MLTENNQERRLQATGKQSVQQIASQQIFGFQRSADFSHMWHFTDPVLKFSDFAIEKGEFADLRTKTICVPAFSNYK
jgi:hypothetical protein